MVSQAACDLLPRDRLVRTARLRGASLVEILVAVAIVAVLAALVLTGTTRARNSAAAAGCVGNLRKIGNAFFLYAADNNGVLPQAFLGPSPNPPGTDWFAFLAPYAGLPEGSSIGKSGLACPAKSSYGHPFSMYGVNYLTVIGLNEGQTGSSWMETGAKRLNGGIDGRAFVLADSQGGFIYPPLIWNLLTDADGDGVKDSHPNWKYNGLDFRHNKKANFFLLNGAIVPMTTAQWGRNENNVWGEPR